MKISEQVNTSCSFLRRPLDSTGKRCNIKKSLPEDESWRCQKIEQNLAYRKHRYSLKFIILLNPSDHITNLLQKTWMPMIFFSQQDANDFESRGIVPNNIINTKVLCHNF